MVGYGVGVAATMARARVPELIADALRRDAVGVADEDSVARDDDGVALPADGTPIETAS